MKKVSKEAAAIVGYKKVSLNSKSASVAPSNQGVTKQQSERTLAGLWKSDFRIGNKIKAS